MNLNSSSCLELFVLAKSPSKTQNDVYKAIFKSLDPVDTTTYIPSNIRAGRSDVPLAIKEAISDRSRRPEQLIAFQKNVMPFIQDNLRMLTGAFLLMLDKDKTIMDTSKIAGRFINEWRKSDFSIQAETFFLGIIEFAFTRGNKRGNPLDGITPNFLKQATRLGKKLNFLKMTSVRVSPIDAPEGARFDAIFHEIPLEQSMPTISLQLFHLDIEANRFTYDTVIKYFRENLFRHVHSLNEIKGYQKDGGISEIHLDARKKLEKKYSTAKDSVIETLFVEACISDSTGADKIVNLLENDSSGVPNGSHGVHFRELPRELKTQGDDSNYQIIIAISAMMQSNELAIQNVFKDIAEVVKPDNTWRNRLFSQSVLLTKMPEEKARLIAETFIPSKSGTLSKPKVAYGVFIGYTAQAKMESKLAREISALAPKIQTYVAANRLESVSFIFYFIPFNDVANDKHTIMEGVIS